MGVRLLFVGAKGLFLVVSRLLFAVSLLNSVALNEKKPLAPMVPFPRGMHEKCKLSFLTDIDKCIKEHKIPPELVLLQSTPQVHTRL